MPKVIILFILLLTCQIITAQEEDNIDSLVTQWDKALEEVVVTGQFLPSDTRSATHEVKVISQDEIQRRGAVNLEQLLQQHTGIRISQDLVLGTGMTLQGLSGENIKIMIDGVPMIGRLGGDIDLSQVLLDNVERVEIIEGPMSAQFGTDALAGVVNIITNKKQKKKYSLYSKISHETQGTWDYQLGLGLRTPNNWSIKVHGGWRDFKGAKNLEDESGKKLRNLIWNPKQQRSLMTMVAYRFNEKHKLSTHFNIFNEQVENDGNVRRPAYRPYAFDDVYKTQRWNPYLQYEGKVSDQFHINTLVSYNHYDRFKNSYRTHFSIDTTYLDNGTFETYFKEDSSVLIPKIVLPNYTVDNQDTTKYNEIKLRSVFSYDMKELPIMLQAGLDFTYDNAVGKRLSDEKENRNNFSQMGDYGMFLRAKYDFNSALRIESAIRYTYNTKYAAPVVPSFHFRYKLDNAWVFRASYGKGFRAPSLKELYFRFIDSNHYIIGNTDLKAERSDNVQFSAAYRWKAPQHAIKILTKGFYNHVQDRIGIYSYEPNPDDPTPEQEYRYYNQAIYKTRGAGINLKYDYDQQLFYTLDISNTGYYVPLSEQEKSLDTYFHSWELSSEVTYHHAPLGLSLSLFGKYNDRLVSFYLAEDENGNKTIKRRTLKPYIFVNVMLGKSLWEDKIKLNVGIENLFDTTTTGVSGAYSSGHSSGGSSRIVALGRYYVIRLHLNLK